jgi:ribosomal protein L33
MAKKGKRETILLLSTAGTGFSYSFTRNVQKDKYTGENMLKKFDPWAPIDDEEGGEGEGGKGGSGKRGKHVLFKEVKAKNAS